MNWENLKKNLFIIYKIIFFSKWIFTKPKKNYLLLYDGNNKNAFNLLFKNEKFSTLYTRYEQINIYILIYTLLKKGFLNIKVNYKISYFKLVAPKIVITLIDENIEFYKFKNIYPDTKYISVQIGLKNKEFFNRIKDYKIKNKNYIFKSDYMFVLGDHDKQKYSDYISGKIFSLGSLRNNSYPIKKNYYGKIKEILFIGGGAEWRIPLQKRKKTRDYIIFHYLKNYCRGKKINLKFLSGRIHTSENFYRDYYEDKDWELIQRSPESYNIINKSQFIVFNCSTMGYEALAKNIKGACFPEKFPFLLSHHGYGDSGFFWSEKIDQKILNKKIDKIIETKNTIWKQKALPTARKIVNYNPYNTTFKKIIDKII